MENPFYTNGRFISPSLNRLRIIDLPGFAAVSPYRNQTGYGLLSKRALRQLISENHVDLKLEPDAPLHQIDACFESDDLIVRETAVALAEECGRRLGIMLLTLKRGDTINRAARPAWDERHWALWAGVDMVWLGGGLVGGYLGKIAAQTAQEVIRAAGYPVYRVQQAENAAHLPLVGLACLAPAGTQALVVLDFGHTAVKRGLAIYKNDNLVALDLLSPVAVDHRVSQTVSPSPTVVATFADWIVDVLVNTWQECQERRSLAPVIGVSMACYMFNGQPPTSEIGFYGRLQLLSNNAQKFLSDRLSTRCAQPLQLTLMHDASAAALSLPKAAGTVMLMLGTAVGNAFPMFNP